MTARHTHWKPHNKAQTTLIIEPNSSPQELNHISTQNQFQTTMQYAPHPAGDEHATRSLLSGVRGAPPGSSDRDSSDPIVEMC